MTVHLCSTVPLGEAEGTTGADSFGRVHGQSGLHIADASLRGGFADDANHLGHPRAGIIGNI